MSRKSDRELYKLIEFILEIIWFIIKQTYKLIVFLLTSFCSMFGSWESSNGFHICRGVVLLLVFVLGLIGYNYRNIIIEKTVEGIFCIRSPSKCLKREVKEDYRENNSSTGEVIE